MSIASMTDQELEAWRAQRTGRAIPKNNSGDANRGPDAPGTSRSPLDGYVNSDPAPAPATPAPAPAADPALQNQLDAALGRLAPLQRQHEEMRAALEAQQRANAQMQSELEELRRGQQAAANKQAASEFNPFEGLPQEDVDMLDPSARALIEAAARNAYAKAAGSIKDPEALIAQALAKRDEKARNDYIRATASALNLMTLSNDAKFNTFLQEDDSASLLLNSFVNAPDLETARSLETRVRTMIKRFEKSTGSTRTPDPQDQLSAHLSRNAQGGTPSGHPAKVATTPEEARQIRNRAAQLMRARKFDEANKLLASINN